MLSPGDLRSKVKARGSAYGCGHLCYAGNSGLPSPLPSVDPSPDCQAPILSPAGEKTLLELAIDMV